MNSNKKRAPKIDGYTDIFEVVAGLLFIIGGLAWPAFLVYVAFHFIMKLW